MAAPGVVDGAGAVPEIHHGTLEAADVPPWRNIDISTRFFILLFLPVGLALTGAIVSSFIFDVGPRTHTHTHTHTKKIPIKQKIRFDKSGFLRFSFLFSFLFLVVISFFFQNRFFSFSITTLIGFPISFILILSYFFISFMFEFKWFHYLGFFLIFLLRKKNTKKSATENEGRRR